MNKLPIHLVCLCLSFAVLAQNEISTLYFGTTLIDFQFQPPQVISSNAIPQHESGASICDPDGNILFYSNGGMSPTAPFPGGVFSPNNQLMQNGELIDSGGCLSSFQGAIILPSPEGITVSNKKYYLFTRDCLESSFTPNPFNAGLTYAIIDMQANNGNGSVISKYNLLVPYQVVQYYKTAHEPLTAVLDTDGEQKLNGDGYWLFSYTKDSLYHIHFGVNGFDQFQLLLPGEGQLVVAPDRKHMAVGNKLYNLDPVQGTLSYLDSLPQYAKVAFSSDGSKMYSIESGTLMQYDMNTSGILSSGVTISAVTTDSWLFLTPAHTIALFNADGNSIYAEVLCPNNLGLSCGFTNSGITLNGGQAPTCPPNIPAHYLYAPASNCSLSMNDFDQNEFNVFPNPSSGGLTIAGSINGSEYSIYNMIGQRVKSGFLENSTDLDLSILPKGVYQLMIQYGDFQMNWQKVVLE